MNRTKFSALISLLFVSLAFGEPGAEEHLVCQTELATGITKIDGAWITTDFQKRTYTIKFNEDRSLLTGDMHGGSYLCDKPFASTQKDYVVCTYPEHSIGETFNYNFSTKRFVFFSPSSAGYLKNIRNPDTESLEVGTCVSL